MTCQQREVKVELLPSLPPGVGARDDRAIVDALDAVAEAKPVRLGRVLELRADLTRAARVVRRDRIQVRERSACRVLDELTGADGSEIASGLRADPPLHGNGRKAVAEKLAAFAARRLVPGHEQHGAAPRSAESRIDAGLADERAVEPEVLVVRPEIVWFMTPSRVPARACMPTKSAASQPRLEELRVLRPLVLNDQLAVGIEVLGHEGVERPPFPAPWQSMTTISVAPPAFAPRTAALISSRVELAPFLVERLAAGDLLATSRFRRRPPCPR